MFLKYNYFLIFPLLFLTGSSFSKTRSKPLIDLILQAKSSKEIQFLLEEDKKQKNLKKLCKKQKEEKRIPVACYELSQEADFWCLKALLNSASQLSEIKQALKSPFLSKKCENHLKSKKELLEYRKKDFFLPELKNYFTE